jgi:Kef-type K+ transport system membrane component KefB
MKRPFVLSLAAVLLLLGVEPLWAAIGLSTETDIVRFLFVLAVMLLAGKFSGELFERIGQPAVLGELIAGALLGASAFGVIPTSPDDSLTEVVKILAEIGVLVLLFEIGIETDLKQIIRTGPAAISVALVGVVVPFGLGFAYWISPLVRPEFNITGQWTTATFIGATLTATSVGITARVLTDMQVMHSLEAKLIIGAAVFDDIIGLVLLGLVSALAAGATVSVLSVGRSLGVAIGFLVVAVAVGIAIAPKFFEIIDRMRSRGVLLVTAFAFTLLIAGLADRAGSAMIIGAFAAGLILSRTNQFDTIEQQIKPVADIFTPVFFLSIGAQMDLRLLNPLIPENLEVLGLALVLFVIAATGKVVAGWGVPWQRFNRPAVGLGMMPRGEVGLIFANIGLAAGVLSTKLFSAVVLVVMATTILAPVFLKWAFTQWGTSELT